MKKCSFRLFLSLLLLIFNSMLVSAHDFEIDGIYYNYTSDGVYVTYAGNSYSEVENEYNGVIRIPATILYNGYEKKVVAVGANAFRDCKNITSIVIGDNILYIYDNAFRDCSNLSKISIGKNLWKIYDTALYGCNALKAVHYNCIHTGNCQINLSSIEEITLGENVKTVSYFANTEWYKKQQNGLLYLDNWLIGYKGDEPTGDITIAEGTTHIDGSSLSYCSSITSVSIPKTVIYIGELFLRSCSKIASLNVAMGNSVYDSRANCNAIIETNTNKIIKACANTIIPNSVTSIGFCSFEELDIISLDIPNSVVDIESSAFYGCNKLAQVNIGDNVINIGDNAFRACTMLKDLKLGDKLTTIGKCAFYDCSSLTNIIIPESVLRIKEDAFRNTGWYNNQTDYPFCLDGWILYDVGWPYIKEGVRGIADRVYYYHDASGSGSLKIPNTVYAIGEWAFSYCGIYYNVVLPNSIKYIATGAFSNNGFSYISLPQGVDSISSAIFQNCRYLSKVVIPKSVKKIESAAFTLCSKITELYVLAANPPIVDNSGIPVFDTSIYDKSTLYVPKGSKEAYLEDAEWAKFTNIVEIETEYKITYVLNDSVVVSDTLTIGENIEGIKMPSKIGYSFNWEKLPSNMPAEDITINGVYTPNKYNIKYNVDGKLYRITSINYGDTISILDEPKKEGYTFSGWDTIPVIMPASDIVINGTFAVNNYSLAYTIDSDTIFSGIYAYGDSLPLIDIPVKEGHTFGGWDTIPVVMPAKDIVISGTFEVNNYSLTCIVDGDTLYSGSVVYGDSLPLIEIPVKEGYTFSGWDSIPKVMPAENVIISGSFAVNYYTVAYVVDGDTISTEGIAYGTEITPIAAPAKEGYTFSGWSYVPKEMPAENITISGSFAVNYYTIAYVVDGDTIASESIAYGAEITPIAAPEKEGYTFSGWSEVPATMPAGGITITGSFCVNYYTLTYVVDGEEYKTEQIAYGDSVVLIDAPVKENYIFSGWSGAPVMMPAEDVTITGSFVHTNISGVMVNAMFKVDGNSITLAGAENSCVAIYSVSGALVNKYDYYDGEEIVLDRGVYVIRIGEKTIKIKL